MGSIIFMVHTASGEDFTVANHGSYQTKSLMPIPTTERWFTPLIRESYSYDIAIATLTASLSIYKAVEPDATKGREWAVIGLSAATAILSVAKTVAAYKKRKRDRTTHELEGCLHTLHAMLIQDQPKEIRLRVTIYAPKDEGNLEQVVNYVGEDSERITSGRSFSNKCGAIGVAYRTKEPHKIHRQEADWTRHQAILMKEVGYSKADAEGLNPSIYSCLAIPLVGNEDNSAVRAVVFLDSTGRDFFDDSKTSLACCACGGIARFVRKRYPH